MANPTAGAVNSARSVTKVRKPIILKMSHRSELNPRSSRSQGIGGREVGIGYKIAEL
jgi:hypothetical protein